MKKVFVFGLLLTTILSLPSKASEQNISTQNQTKLDMTIYNNNRALVKDTRSVPLQAGENEIAYSDISGQLIPASVLLSGQGITLLENNFNFDVLSYQSLLEKSVGNTVTLSYMNPKTGLLETNSAELLAINGGSPTLKINGKIDSSYPGRILFNHIPENLRSKPTLVMKLHANTEAKQNLTLNYLTHGLSWDANYVAELAKDNQHMTLNGWITLTNHSGTAYKNAHMQVVAGDIHTVNEEVVLASHKRARVAMDGMALSDANVQTENIGDYHMYSLPRTTDILDKQTKQISLLSANQVGIDKVYTFEGQLRPSNEIKNVKPTIKINFKNTKDNHLGIALPRGVVRLYQADSKGELIFLGEDRINHVGNLEEVSLRLGQAFDISASAKRTNQKTYTQPANGGLTKHIEENTYEVTVKNGTSAPTEVIISEYFGGNWQILSETHPSTKTTAQQAKWIVSVPAEGETTFTYSVRQTNTY